MNTTPNETFLALQAAREAEQLSRQHQQEAAALYADGAPPIRPAWPLRFDLSGQ